MVRGEYKEEVVRVHSQSNSELALSAYMGPCTNVETSTVVGNVDRKTLDITNNHKHRINGRRQVVLIGG
jgi:hypothetical protein